MQGLYDGEFAGFKAATSEQLDAALHDAVVAVDASVLLDLYRFRAQTSQDLSEARRSSGRPSPGAPRIFGVVGTARLTVLAVPRKMLSMRCASQAGL